MGEARGVERPGRSFERALVTGEPDRMTLQRYDVPDTRAGGFIEKSWLPTNSPIRDSVARRARAQMLIDRSEQAVDRVSRRITASR
jgi:hypothetical protein